MNVKFMWDLRYLSEQNAALLVFHPLNGRPNATDFTTFQAIEFRNPKRFSISDILFFTYTTERSSFSGSSFHLSLSLFTSRNPA
jgi:hypothetical protein